MNINLFSYNPLYGYIEFSVLGKKLSDFGNDVPDCVMSLNFERKTKPASNYAGCTFTIELYDDTAVEIEYILSEAMVQFQSKKGITCTIGYGWSSRGKKITGFTLNGIITEYSLSFDGPSITLSVEGTVEGNNSISLIESKEFNPDVFGGNPSEIVKKICEEKGIPIGKIEETEPIMDKAQGNKPATFLQKSQSAIEFINKNFANAKSKKTGKNGFCFYIGKDSKAYFVSTDTSNMENVKLVEAKEKKTSGALDIGSVIKLDDNIGKAFEKLNNLMSSANKIMGTVNEVKGLLSSPSGGSHDTGSKSSTSSTQGNVILVGGTSVKNIKGAIPENDNLVYVYKDGANYSWLSDSLDTIKQYCNVGSRVYFLLGDRDIQNASKYVDFYKSLSSIEKEKGCQIYAVSVLPVDSNKCDTVYNSNLLNFNIELSKGLVSSDVKFLDLFTYYRKELATRDTKSNGIDYKNQIYQDVFNRIINYNFTSEDSYYKSLSATPITNELSNVDKTAVALSNVSQDKAMSLVYDIAGICNGNGDYVKTTKDLLDILAPNNTNVAKIRNYVDTASTIVSALGKNNSSVDYSQISSLISKLDLPNDAKRSVDLATNITKILNNRENIKSVEDSIGLAKDLAGLLVGTGDAEKYQRTAESIFNVVGKGANATSSDYLSLTTSLASIVSPSVGNTVTKYANLASNVIEIINNGKCELGNCAGIASGVINAINPNVGQDVKKYVDLASNVSNALKGGSISDYSSLANSLGSLNGNSEVGNYVRAAQDIWGVFNNGSLKSGMDLDKFTMNLGSSLNTGNLAKSDVAKNVESALKGVGSGNLSPASISKGVSENLSDMTSGGGIGGALKGKENLPDKANSVSKGLSNIVNKNKKEVSASYEYYSGNNKASIVLSFSPTVLSKSIQDKSQPGTVYSIDSVRNEMIAVTANNDLSEFLDGYKEGRNSLILGLSASNFEKMSGEVAGLWHRYYGNNIKAELEVMGDVDVCRDTYIKIAVYTKYGFLHHTSGYYYVESVTDSVSGGSFTTSLSLRKSTDKLEDGGNKKTTPQESAPAPRVEETGNKIKGEPEGKYWVRQGPGVTLTGCQDRVLNVLEALGKWYYDRNGGKYKLVVTAGTNGSHASGTYSHANGWKVDVNDWGGPENNPGGYLVDNASGQYVEDWRPAFRDYGHSLGLGMAIEGDHIDVQFGDGYDWVDGNTYGPVRV